MGRSSGRFQEVWELGSCGSRTFGGVVVERPQGFADFALRYRSATRKAGPDFGPALVSTTSDSTWLERQMQRHLQEAGAADGVLD
jgi:hypothetical protein